MKQVSNKETKTRTLPGFSPYKNQIPFFTKLKIRKLKDLVHIKNQIHFLSELRGRKLKVLVHIKKSGLLFYGTKKKRA